MYKYVNSSKVFSIFHMPIFFHRSLFFSLLIPVILSFFYGHLALVFGFTFLLVLITHEMGHVFIAKLLGYRIESVFIYPFFGKTVIPYFEAQLKKFKDLQQFDPFNILDELTELKRLHDLDQLMISFGGIIFNLVLLLPAISYLHFFSGPTYSAFDNFLLIFCSINLGMVLINFLPIKLLDGFKIWKLTLNQLQKDKDSKPKNKKIDSHYLTESNILIFPKKFKV